MIEVAFALIDCMLAPIERVLAWIGRMLRAIGVLLAWIDRHLPLIAAAVPPVQTVKKPEGSRQAVGTSFWLLLVGLL
ncbi:hypothetical protein JNUCC1_01038 [Lentibacillus sp. JNUCC-1]|nr:hypothetical protein [Lentibacillus sp. JNUCC-1]